MTGGKILDKIQITLRDIKTKDHLPVWIDVYDTSLGRKWLTALNGVLADNLHLEKNFCFLGFAHSDRSGPYILEQINRSISAINSADLGYQIDDEFTMENCLGSGPVGSFLPGRQIQQEKMNLLHRYFEDLQGFSGHLSEYAAKANAEIKWHIRQLNLLCHEFENWAISYRKDVVAKEWSRPSQLMCWLNAPRFILDEKDHELFGIETINRPLGGVFVGVNKAVGKHHWEVFNDENRSIDELTTSALRSQTEAAGDFDIEWGNDPGEYYWQKQRLAEFRIWLRENGWDPEDPGLTIGHPKVGQVDLMASFGSTNFQEIWDRLYQHLDVWEVRTSDAAASYDYHWSDPDFMANQVAIIQKGK